MVVATATEAGMDMCSKQNTPDEGGLLGKNRVEPEGIRKALSMSSPAEDGIGDRLTVDLLERIIEMNNLVTAARKVIANKGAPGVDGMTVEELLPYLEKHGPELIGLLRTGRYSPRPVRRVEIDKPDGGTRLLGIPSVIDRMFQQAVAQVLVPMYEPKFSDASYGFRPGRSAHDALIKVRDYYIEGYTHVVDIDLAKFFDTVNHEKLVRMLREEIKDERVISLIRKFLKSGVLIGGLFSRTEEGVPQGGPLSPLLSNIYLTKFDRTLEQRGLRFVRYADDCNIFVKSRRAAERVMTSATRYLERALLLKVNQAKSLVGSPLKVKFLGFSLWKFGDKAGIRIHEKSVKRFKKKVIEITKRNRGLSVREVTKQLKRYTVGWLGYYWPASMAAKVKAWDAWIRRRLRCYIWKQWKRIKKRMQSLVKLGANKTQAWKWANSRKGYWRVSKSLILHTTLTNEELIKVGFDELTRRYKKLRTV